MPNHLKTDSMKPSLHARKLASRVAVIGALAASGLAGGCAAGVTDVSIKLIVK
jgi:hypothetical protein